MIWRLQKTSAIFRQKKTTTRFQYSIYFIKCLLYADSTIFPVVAPEMMQKKESRYRIKGCVVE